jgi:hypothetical protein
MPLAGIRKAQRLRELARVSLRLLEQHDIGLGRADRVINALDIHLISAEPDIEDHDPQLDRFVGLRPRRRYQRQQQRERCEDVSELLHLPPPHLLVVTPAKAGVQGHRPVTYPGPPLSRG